MINKDWYQFFNFIRHTLSGLQNIWNVWCHLYAILLTSPHLLGWRWVGGPGSTCDRPCHTHHTTAACQDLAWCHSYGSYTSGSFYRGHLCSVCTRVHLILDGDISLEHSTLQTEMKVSSLNKPTFKRTVRSNCRVIQRARLFNFVDLCHERDATVVQRVASITTDKQNCVKLGKTGKKWSTIN